MTDENTNEKIKKVEKQGKDGPPSVSKPRPIPGSKKYRGGKEKKEVPENPLK